jgi:hypothetical protein
MDYARHYLALAAVPRLREGMNWKAGAEYTKLQWKRVNSLMSSVDYSRLPLYHTQPALPKAPTASVTPSVYLIGKSGKDCIMLSLINWIVALCFGYVIPLRVVSEMVARLVGSREGDR